MYTFVLETQARVFHKIIKSDFDIKLSWGWRKYMQSCQSINWSSSITPYDVTRGIDDIRLRFIVLSLPDLHYVLRVYGLNSELF